MMKRVSKSLAETETAAGDFLDLLKKGKRREGAEVVGLFGDLGAGKTTFVQAIARLSGIKGSVTSPTFVIIKRYERAVPTSVSSKRLRLGQAPRSGLGEEILEGTAQFTQIIHIDAYRLKSGEELMKLNFAEMLADPDNLILIEWPENVSSALPKEIHKLYFKFIDENSREIDF